MSIAGAAPHVDARDFRNVMGLFVTGVTVVTTAWEGRTHGMTASAFMSGSLDPALVIISVDQRAHMHGLLQRGDRYGISVLADTHEAHCRHFAGRSEAGLPIEFATAGGVPVLIGALATIAARIVDRHPCGDHTLFIGEVEQLDYRDGRPLAFFRGNLGTLVPCGGAAA